MYQWYDNKKEAKYMTTKQEERDAFSKRLSFILDKAGVAQKGHGRQLELSEAMGLTQKGVGKWLTGGAIPTKTNLIKLVSLYKEETGVTIEWLLTGDENYKPKCMEEGWSLEDEKSSVKIIEKYSTIPIVNFSELSMFLNSTNKNKDFKRMHTNEEVTENAFMIRIESNEFTPYLKTDQIAIVEPTQNTSETIGLKVLAVINNRITIVEHLMHDTDYFYPLRGDQNGIKIDHIKNFELIGYITRRITSEPG